MATGPTQVHPPMLTPASIAALSPSDRRAYFQKLQSTDPKAAANQAAQYAEMRRQANAHYMAASIDKRAVCPPASGSGTTNAIPTTGGGTLIWNIPTAGGAFLHTLLFEVNATVTNAAGTGATYAANAGAPYSLFPEVRVKFNGQQVRTRPYIAKVIAALRGYDRALPGKALQNNNATIDAAIVGTVPVATGANTWNFFFRLPLAALHEASPAGVLPMMGSGTQAQVELDVTNSPLGFDPLNSPVSVAGGTGNATTLGGTVKLVAIYKDGTNYFSPTPLKLDLDGEPTVQYVIDTPLSPLTAGSVVRQRISTLLQHYYVCHIVVDGVQSTTFSTLNNLQMVELDEDSVGQNKLVQIGTNTNLSINDYYEAMRYYFAQDLDVGVIAHIVGAQMGQTNPSNREGQQILNMTPGGWTDINHAWQVGAVSSANFNPRVETFLVSANPAGLLVV